MGGFVCPPGYPATIPAGASVHPGFGIVELRVNGAEQLFDTRGQWTIDHYTTHAQQTPGVWTLHIDGPLRSAVYAFTPPDVWTLTDTKDGFA